MARKLRVEYPGAVYHVMNRGDRREPIFLDQAGCHRFGKITWGGQAGNNSATGTPMKETNQSKTKAGSGMNNGTFCKDAWWSK